MNDFLFQKRQNKEIHYGIHFWFHGQVIGLQQGHGYVYKVSWELAAACTDILGASAQVGGGEGRALLS